MIYKVYGGHAASAVAVFALLRRFATCRRRVYTAYIFNIIICIICIGLIAGGYIDGAGWTAQTTMIAVFPCTQYIIILSADQLGRCARNFNKTRYRVWRARFMHPPLLLLMLQHARAVNRGIELSMYTHFMYIASV